MHVGNIAQGRIKKYFFERLACDTHIAQSTEEAGELTRTLFFDIIVLDGISMGMVSTALTSLIWDMFSRSEEGSLKKLVARNTVACNFANVQFRILLRPLTRKYGQRTQSLLTTYLQIQ